MQKQNFSQGGFMPQNSQYYRKVKYPDKVAKPKRLVFVRIFLFRSEGSKITYFPTIPFLLFKSYDYYYPKAIWLCRYLLFCQRNC